MVRDKRMSILEREFDNHRHEGHRITPDAIDNKDYSESVQSISSSGGTSLDLLKANFFDVTLTGDVTFSFDNPTSDPTGNSFTLIVQQDATGGHNITWPSSVEWHNGTSPGLSTGSRDKHLVAFVTPDGGNTWIGIVSAEEIA